MIEPDWNVEERIPIRRMLTLADLFSVGNGFLGLLALMATHGGHLRTAYTLILVAAVFDGIDGYLSRMGHGGGRLGGKLDTLSDLVSFVVAPSFLLWIAYKDATVMGLGTAPAQLASNAVLLLAIATFFGAGLLRLARFDYLKGGDRHDYFVGITTPMGAGVLVSIALLGWPVPAMLVAVVLTAVLMTSRVRLPKLRGTLAPAAALVILVAAVLGPAFGNLGPILLLTASMAYLFLGPGYVRRHEEPDETPLGL